MSEVERLQAEIDALRTALQTYGRHKSGCELIDSRPDRDFNPPCTCGFRAALAAPTEERDDG